MERDVRYKDAHLLFPSPSFKTSVISLFSPMGLPQFSRCHFSENHNTNLAFIEDKQGCMNSTMAQQTNLNIILTHKFPFSSVKAELCLRFGNNKEKILLSVAPKSRLAEALVGSLLKTKGLCGSQEKQKLFSITQKRSIFSTAQVLPLALLLLNCSSTDLQFPGHQ